MMSKPKKWLEKLNNLCLHEKVVFFSLCIVLLILSFDCWLKNLPITGYALILITIIIVGFTTWGTCHGIRWLLHCDRPLKYYIIEKSQNENLLRLIDFVSNKENDIFDRIFNSKDDTFSSFKYPTNLNEQVRLFLKDTEKDFIKTWYSEISQNPSFLFDSHLLLEEIVFKIIAKVKNVKCKNLILNILFLYLNHLQEYKKCVKKIAKTKNSNKLGNNEGNSSDKGADPKGRELKLSDVYRYTHPGSQSDEIANYYLTKAAKWIFQEHAPQEFVTSLQSKILTGILAKKVLKTALTTIEDPIWINIKLIHLLDSSKYEELLQNKVYVIKDKVIEDFHDVDHQKKKPLIITKRYMKSNLFDGTTNLFQKTDFNELKNKIAKNDTDKVHKKTKKPVEKGSLNLPLINNNNYNPCFEGQGSHISSALGGIISSTAAPLLPDNISVCYEPMNKMWQSPIREDKKVLSEPIAVPIGKTVVEGVKIDKKQAMKNKRLSRSKSTDSVSPAADVNECLMTKDLSIGEELCENVRFTSKEDVTLTEVKEEKPNLKQTVQVKKLTKTKSFDNGSIPVGNASTESAPEREVVEHSVISTAEGYRDSDVSPVYEEPEDFATTIAKLRSLLQQRESSSTLSDKSGQSVDLPNNSSMTDSSNKTQSTDSDNCSFDSQVAPDIPTDGRPFINVTIPKTEVTTDSNGSTSVIYVIQYDGIYKLKEQSSLEESELLLQTTVVRRKFQEFVNLQNRLEEYGNLKSALKGIKGPSKWMNLTLSGKTDESTTANRRQVLEVFLQQLCSKVEICAVPEIHEFLAYGCSGSKTFVKKDMESPIRRIDKLLTNKVTDVFNTIKTALPSFDFDSTNSISSGDSNKGSQEQKLLPGFLSFGNKTEEYELNLEFSYKEPTGDSMADDIRRYLNAKSDSVENAMDVLDSNEWLAEKRECRLISSEGKCLWHNYKDLLDEDVDQLDTWLPVYSVILDIICELLDESDSWVIKEPVVRLIKVLTGHWEAKIEEKLSKLDWDQIVGNLIRLLRTITFHAQSPTSESIELDNEYTKTVLKDLILRLLPDCLSQFIKFDELSSAISLFVDSFQHFRPNRDVILRFFDILLVQFLSCHHLTNSST